ncbi:MAG: formylglycine-generating enzyme family protein, partial [Thermogutta sp.]|nr:formylglycine-generating enzyme family protein [Thermogutta sp.]
MSFPSTPGTAGGVLAKRRASLGNVLVGPSAFALGLLWEVPARLGNAVMAMGYGLWRRKRQDIAPKPFRPRHPGKAAHASAEASDDPDSLARQLLDQGRFALILRPQVAGTISREVFETAFAQWEQTMALVPDGEVSLSRAPADWEEKDAAGDQAAGRENPEPANDESPTRERIARVRRYFLDRYPVTNAQFAAFVAAGGYEQASLWDAAILPAVLDFVDRSGRPGPRYWENGSYPPGMEDHPVTGVNWYEARAFARWLGKRLPTDAEWMRAAAWPVSLPDGTRMQRRFPWGDAMDYSRAVLWGSQRSGTVPVTDCPGGAAVNGIYQLIGNVWEWTHSDYQPWEEDDARIVLPGPMKSIRGGAFDTYFDHQ